VFFYRKNIHVLTVHFFVHSFMYRNVIQNLIFFGFGRKFAGIDSVLCRSAYSLCTAKYSWRILLTRLYSLSVFSVHVRILWVYLETTLLKRNHSKIAVISVYAKRILHILQICFNTFGVFSCFDKTLLSHSRNSQKELRIH
jgi:hypothetical protein